MTGLIWQIPRRRLFEFFFLVFALIWTTQMYGAVGNHPTLAWLYPALIVLFETKFAIVASVYMGALIAAEMLSPRWMVPEIGLAIQTLLVAYWTRGGALIRRSFFSSSSVHVQNVLGDALRPVFIVLSACFASTILFRQTTIAFLLWAAILACAAWSIRPLRFSGWKSAMSTALLLVLGLVPAIAVLEIGCRLLFPLAAPSVSITAYDREALWTLGRKATGEMTYGVNALGEPVELASYSVAISGQGLRDREFGPKQPGEIRVLLLGDSFTFGWGLEIDQTVGRQLEDMLNASGANVKFTVINAGVEGYGPWQERICLGEVGFALEPDIVILQLYPGNDINNSLNKIGKRVRAFDPLWEHIVESRRHWSRWEVRVDDWLRKRSAFYNVLARAMNVASPLMDLLNDLRFYHRRTPPLPETAERPFWLEVHLKEWYPELNEGCQIMESDTLAIRDDCVRRGIPFVLYTAPDVNSVCDYSWDWNMDQVKDASIYERGKDLKVAEAFCTREKLSCIDLARAMRAGGNPCELYYEADGHLTPKGAKVTAQAILEYLASSTSLLHAK